MQFYKAIFWRTTIDQQGLSDIKTEAKPNETVDNLETIFDTLDVAKLTSDIVITSDEKSSNTDNSTENNEDRLLQEPTEKKIKMSVRKTKRK